MGHEVQNLAKLHAEHRYIFTDVAELDICDEEAVNRMVEKEAVDCIINCAAYTAVDKAEANEAIADKLNAVAPKFLAHAVNKRGGIMVQISTDYVFDGTGCIPYREEMKTCPNSVYGRTKLKGEEAVFANCERTVVLRTAWLYSPYGNNFVKTMLRLGREKDHLGVIFDQIGTPTYARDLAAAIFVILEKGVQRGIFHFTNEGVISWYDFTKAIHRLSGITNCCVLPLRTDQYPTAAVRPHYSVLDKSKIKETYHLEIPYWEDSLRECIAILEQQEKI